MQGGSKLLYLFRFPASILRLAPCAQAHHKATLVQIDSQIPLLISFHRSPSLSPGADSAVAGSTNLPFKVAMPYAGATVTGLTKLLHEVLRLNPLAQPVTYSAPVPKSVYLP